jgi:SAM-dependent methyltransferase
MPLHPKRAAWIWLLSAPLTATPRSCPVCAGERWRTIESVGAGFRLEECAGCGLVATAPPVQEETIAAYYPVTYYGEANRRFHRVLEALIRVFRARRCAAIERRVARGRLLDVGCGRGLLPYLLRRRGWDAWGLEISEIAAANARDVFGVPMHVGSLEQSPFAPGSMDAVVFWHVLEHVRDPGAALRRSREILRPRGLLVIAVPNYDSLQARWTGRHWFHLDVPRHYHHFRTGTLRRILEVNGFTVESVHHFSVEQNPYGWIQSLLNKMGLRRDHLYEVLKSPSARSERNLVRRYPLQSLLTFVALIPVLPASLALFLIETVLRRGGTIEIYARKS